ncbi:unnamed protein product, partial [Heterosigma akashiwo]
GPETAGRHRPGADPQPRGAAAGRADLGAGPGQRGRGAGRPGPRRGGTHGGAGGSPDRHSAERRPHPGCA